MKRIYPLILLLILQNFAIIAQFNASFGFINVSNGTGSVDPGPFPQVPGLKILPFKAVGVAQQPSATGRFSFSGWGTVAVNGSDDAALFTGSFSGLQYYEVALAPQLGYTLQVTRLLFHMRRSSTGVRFFSVRSSADNFSTNLSAYSGSSNGVTVYPQNEFFWLYDSSSTSGDQKVLSVDAMPGVTSSNDTVVFRFYAWNAESTSGSFSIDNVTISGACNSISADVQAQVTTTNSEELMIDAQRQLAWTKNNTLANWFLYSIAGELLDQKIANYIDFSSYGSACYIILAECNGMLLRKKITRY